MGEDKAREVLLGLGMSDEEATDFIEGVKRGLRARREGKLIPWSEVKRKLGIDEVSVRVADKQWTMNCILAGVEVARLVAEHKLQGATDRLTNLTSELTAIDIEFLVNRILAMMTK